MRAAALAFLLLAAAAPADKAEQDALSADSRAAALRRDADAADDRARTARHSAIELARRIQNGEARVSTIEAGTARLERMRRQQRAHLAAQHGEISRLLAVLQTLSRRPAGLVLLEPSSAVTTARVSALLEAVQPTLRDRTNVYRRDLARSRALQTRLDTSKRQLLAANTDLSLAIRQLDTVQTDLRAARDSLDREADEERGRARTLAAQAMDLRGLAGAFDDGVSTNSRRLAPPRPVRNAAPLPFPYLRPAAGSIVEGFEDMSHVGVRARGMTLSTRKGAQVVAPAQGRIAYAGPFRTYGDIVIVQHPGGLLSMMSGLERVDVLVGETVSAGTPIGRMGSLDPELYLELRRDGRPIDPAQHVRKTGGDG
ncbi:murein hydrolase activator EnvC family protein [Sphingosinicella soli]|uniref:Septal ring factor EnvC (AmiA/AmiB activator) n=1 Tax=Sphingosinicella soli TaxID=333708 RepID=A0A7W7B0B5_9SPHN|nr:peptidoglycan DD-metalloendopeptidase family protein [Sphingosinicella soli]MBB4631693.1 septal ring factor EnvC (AmiA/AmiB activator) [Sphingosinicella soli]